MNEAEVLDAVESTIICCCISDVIYSNSEEMQIVITIKLWGNI